MNDGHSALFERAVTEPGLSAGFDFFGVTLAPRDESRGAAPFPARRGGALPLAPPRVAQYLARGVVPGDPGNAAAGMRSRAAHVQALERPAIVAVSEHGSGGEQLVERERAVEDVAADQTEFALEI